MSKNINIRFSPGNAAGLAALLATAGARRLNPRRLENGLSRPDRRARCKPISSLRPREATARARLAEIDEARAQFHARARSLEPLQPSRRRTHDRFADRRLAESALRSATGARRSERSRRSRISGSSFCAPRSRTRGSVDASHLRSAHRTGRRGEPRLTPQRERARSDGAARAFDPRRAAGLLHMARRARHARDSRQHARGRAREPARESQPVRERQDHARPDAARGSRSARAGAAAPRGRRPA